MVRCRLVEKLNKNKKRFKFKKATVTKIRVAVA